MSSLSTSLVITLSLIQQKTIPYIYSLFLIFGVIGCCFNIFLLSSRRQFRIVTCFTYIVAASVAMLISLSFGIGTSLYLLNPIQSASLSSTFYKIRVYVLQSSSIMYRWFFVAASFDRYAVSSINLHLRNFARMNIARRIIAAIVVIWLVLPIYNLIYSTTIQSGTDNVYIIGILYFHSTFTAIAGCILPGTIMIIFAFLIHHNLVLKRKRRRLIIFQQRGTQNEINGQEQKRDRQVFLILIVQIIMFVITIIPLIVGLLYNVITLNIKDKSIERLATERFYSLLAEMIAYLFPTLSFYLYTMTCSVFRNEFVNIIRSILRCRCLSTNTRVEPVTNTIQRRTAYER